MKPARCLLPLLLALGCEARPAAVPPENAGNVASKNSDDFPRSITDSAGFSVTLPARPLRIVSTSPSITEILFTIGAGDQVVGVTTYCNYPAEAEKREKIGGFAPKSISVEKIVALKPDLVVTSGRLHQGLTESLRNLGLTTLSYDAQSLDEVVGNIRSLGAATGQTATAEPLAASLEKRREAVRKRVASVPVERRPRVLLVLSDDPLVTAGPNTMVGQMLDVAGGRNLFDDTKLQFPKVSEEEIVKRNPQVILIWEMGDTIARLDRLKKRPGWDQFDAVRNDRVLHIADEFVSRKAPRLFDGLEKLADILHPETKPAGDKK